MTGAADTLFDGRITLSGVVHPNGRNTNYYFQWGRAAAHASTSVMGPIHADPTGVKVEIPARELRAGTTYRYRLVATNTFATTMGPHPTFTTPPADRPNPPTAR